MKKTNDLKEGELSAYHNPLLPAGGGRERDGDEVKQTRLEKGKLYQVRNHKGWVIAEYVAKIEAHTATGYRSVDGSTSWHEPAQHHWNSIMGGGRFIVYDKGLQVRDVTPDALAEIARLKADIDRLSSERTAIIKELRALCN